MLWGSFCNLRRRAKAMATGKQHINVSTNTVNVSTNTVNVSTNTNQPHQKLKSHRLSTNNNKIICDFSSALTLGDTCLVANDDLPIR
jgi:hypothetical protein